MAPAQGRRKRKLRASQSIEQIVDVQYPEFEIPYFAHQQLDPSKYTPSVGLPVGKPGWAPAPKEIATARNGGWIEDADAPLEEDPDGDSELNSPVNRSDKNAHPGSAGKNPYKRLKVAGGRPAIAKKVTADLDSDDELIVRMKNAKYLEKDIAQRLIDEGRVAYHPKTIGTRWARIRKALEERNDELLDAELTDWHDGDDDVLYQAIGKANEIIERVKADADNRKWRIVADQMKNLKPVVSFSQNACRGRYEDLQAGRAKPTPESIPNPDEDTLRRIQSRAEKERLINEDKNMVTFSPLILDNIEGNAWTSKSRKYQ